MISQKLIDAFNEQINKEFYSEYFYLAMAAWFDSENLQGCSNFFKIQVQEERFHAMKMYDYVNERGGKVILEAIEKPEVDFKSALEIFEKAYDHERLVTSLVNNLMDVAIEEKDHATKSFLNWFIDEQVEEEASMDAILNKLKLINGDGMGLLMLDKELSLRTFTPPAK